jgi:hypothetical protein
MVQNFPFNGVMCKYYLSCPRRRIFNFVSQQHAGGIELAIYKGRPGYTDDLVIYSFLS